MAVILLLQLLEAFGLGCFHPSVQLLPAVIGRGLHLQGTTDIGDALALVEQLLSGTQLAEDLFWCVALALHGASRGRFWPLMKLSYELVQFLGCTSMDPATTGFTEAAADRTAWQCRGVQQHTTGAWTRGAGLIHRHQAVPSA